MPFRLEPYQLSNAKLRYEAVVESKDHLLPWIPWAANYTLEKSEEWIEKAVRNFDGHEYPFKIMNEQNEYAGEFRLIEVRINTFERMADTACWIRKQYARQGAATAALKLAARFAFEELSLYRLQILILPENERSLTGALKAGAKKEGQLRNHWNFNGVMHSPILLSLIPEDLESY